MDAYRVRMDQLGAALASRGCAAAVVGPSDHMRYLIGWAEPAYERLIALVARPPAPPVLLAPAMSAQTARDSAPHWVEVIGWDDAAGWEAEASRALPNTGVIAVDDELRAGHLLRLQALRPRARWDSASGALDPLRSRKSASEVGLLNRAGDVADKVCGDALQGLRAGITEAEAQAAIESAYRVQGADTTMALICYGANSAVPHHASGSSALCDGEVVLIDTGARLSGYWSDITRTVAFGQPDPEAFRVYDAVYRAHRAAASAVHPGATGEQVDRAARQVIEAAGYGPYFTHRTGHGIGLSIHEPPYLAGGNCAPLEEGECFTIEPGIYLPGRFGVRIEAVVTVTATGVRYLNSEPPSRLEVLEIR